MTIIEDVNENKEIVDVVVDKYSGDVSVIDKNYESVDVVDNHHEDVDVVDNIIDSLTLRLKSWSR